MGMAINSGRDTGVALDRANVYQILQQLRIWLLEIGAFFLPFYAQQARLGPTRGVMMITVTIASTPNDYELTLDIDPAAEIRKFMGWGE